MIGIFSNYQTHFQAVQKFEDWEVLLLQIIIKISHWLPDLEILIVIILFKFSAEISPSQAERTYRVRNEKLQNISQEF